MRKNDIEIVSFQEKRSRAKKKRNRQITGVVALGVTCAGLLIGAIGVLGRSNDVSAEKQMPMTALTEADPKYKTIQSVLNGTNEQEKNALAKQQLEAEQAEKVKVEKEQQDAIKKAEEEQVAAINKLVEEEVEKATKDAQTSLEESAKQVESLAKANQSLMTENENLKKEIEALKSSQKSGSNTSTSSSSGLGSVEIPQ